MQLRITANVERKTGAQLLELVLAAEIDCCRNSLVPCAKLLQLSRLLKSLITLTNRYRLFGSGIMQRYSYPTFTFAGGQDDGS